ncbi:MAG: hemerythrin domain-containing protein [Actinoplanes sp.]
MEIRQTISPDVVDVLHHEHLEIRRLCTDVLQAGRDHRKRPLAALQQAVHLHQLGEVAIVHPAVRNSGPNATVVALECQVKGELLDRSLTELDRLGSGHPDFDERFAEVSDALLDHVTHQERDEFPLLRRYVSTQRLHMMAGAMRDAQIMGGQA